MAIESEDQTAFFGRQREIADLEKRLLSSSSNARLISIVGLGGIGKTRLALEVAGRTKRNPIIHVPLGPEVRTLAAAVRAIAEAAGIKVKAESEALAALDVVARGIGAKTNALVILDSTEQLGEVARDLIAHLLKRGSDDLVVLATAREPVGSKGEEKVVLGPLEEVEAIALLLDRARLAGSGDLPTEEQARAIVTRLDRLPLAIELAASRLEMLSPKELLERLSLAMLVDASGSAAPTHKTMRKALEWSWDLLSDSEKSALTQVCVFAAPFTIEAAEEIVSVPGEEVLDLVESLMKRSLLLRQTGADGRARLAMYETVRAWARDKGMTPAVVMEHARYHLQEAERAASMAYGSQGVEALDTLEALLPELLAAFEATKERDPAVAARIALSLADLLLFRGLLELRAELFDAGAEAAERAKDDRLLARALIIKARVTMEVGRVSDAEKELRRALDLAEKTGDEVTKAEALRSLGWALSALGDLTAATKTINEAKALHRAHGSARGHADAHVALGILAALQGRPAEGLEELRAALAIHVEHGDVIRQEKVLGFAGIVGHDAKEVARGLPRDVLARAPKSHLDVLPAHVADLVRTEKGSESSEGWQQAIDFYQKGSSAHERSDGQTAIGFFDRALAALERTGMKQGVAAIHGHAAATFALLLDDPKEAKARLDKARAALADDPGNEVVVDVFAAAVDCDAVRGKVLLERAARAEIGSPQLAIATRVLEQGLGNAPPPSSSSPRPPAPKTETAAFIVGKEARWITPPRGDRIDLVRYGPVRRLLDRLVVARLDQPDTALSAEALIEAGWPNERMRHTAGLLRVYSAIRRLRRLGLEAVLVTRDDGYLLDPNASVIRGDES